MGQGCAIGWLSPSLPLLFSADRTPLPLDGAITAEQAGWIGSMVSIGGISGTFCMGLLTQAIGTKRSLLLCAGPLMVGTKGESTYHIISIVHLTLSLDSSLGHWSTLPSTSGTYTSLASASVSHAAVCSSVWPCSLPRSQRKRYEAVSAPLCRSASTAAFCSAWWPAHGSSIT